MTTTTGDWTYVTSSHLNAIKYDSRTRTLRVWFNDGSVYRYSGVPAGVVRDLLATPSVGGYFARFVRNNYPYEQEQSGA